MITHKITSISTEMDRFSLSLTKLIHTNTLDVFPSVESFFLQNIMRTNSVNLFYLKKNLKTNLCELAESLLFLYIFVTDIPQRVYVN